MAGKPLEWINLGQDQYGLDRRAKTRIRTHAMRATAELRRADGTWGKINRRQYPSCTNEGSEAEEGVNNQKDEKWPQPMTINFSSSSRARPSSRRLSGPSVVSSRALIPIRSTPRFPIGRSMPLMGFELLRAELGIDVLDLSVLTLVQFGQTASVILDAEPSRLGKLITRRRRSYLSHIPARYNQYPYLDDAIRCLAIRARRRLGPSDRVPEAREISIYGKALKSLQAAVDNSNTYSDPNFLCAIEVLSLFELLDSSRRDAWTQHIAGAARLIRLRGPYSFCTEYEKLLFVSLLGPIASECWRSYESCFFDEPEWQRALKSLTLERSEPFSLRSDISMKLWSRAVAAPGLFRRVGNIIFEDKSAEELQVLRQNIKQFCVDLTRWYNEYTTLVKQRPAYRFYPADYDMRYEMLAGYHGMLSVGLRLQTALDGKDLKSLEKEVLYHTECLRRTICEVSERNTWASYFLEQNLVFEAAAMSTTDIWMKDPHKPGQIIQGWKLAAYFRAIRDGSSTLHFPFLKARRA